jgi:uncharacterized protein (TIRG00374 family)
MKRSLGTLLRVTVSVGLLLYLLHTIFRAEAREPLAAAGELSWAERTRIIWSVGPSQLWERFAAADLRWWAVAALLQGLALGLVIVRWRLLLAVQHLQLSLGRIISIFFTGHFFNAFMLGSTGGDVMKAWLVTRETPDRKPEAVTSVVIDRIIGLFSLFLIALIAMAIHAPRVSRDPQLRGFAITVTLVVVGLIACAVAATWRNFPSRFPGLHQRLARLPGYETARRLFAAYRVYAARPWVIAQAILLSLAVHAVSMLCIVCVGKALAISQATVADYFLFLPVVNIATAVPISISGLGVREALYALLFAQVGVPAAQAVALSLLGHLATLLWSLVGGLFFLAAGRARPAPPA